MDRLEIVELIPALQPRGTVIWLHGLGADGQDFVPVAQALRVSGEIPLRHVFPHAPLRPVSINQGRVMRAWYDVAHDGLVRRPDDAGLLKSVEQVEALIESEVGRGTDPSHLIVVGFSQGGAVALTLGTRRPQSLGGIVALSSYLPMPDRLASASTPISRRTPIFMAHGLHDEVISLQMGENSRRDLDAAGYDVEWHTYPMAHSVCLEEIEALSSWLNPRLATDVQSR